jgi:hypothetical protein
MKRTILYVLLLVILPLFGWADTIDQIPVFFDPAEVFVDPALNTFGITLKADIPAETAAISWTLNLIYDPNVLGLEQSHVNDEYWTSADPNATLDEEVMLIPSTASEISESISLFGFAKTDGNGKLIPVYGSGIELTTLDFILNDTHLLPTVIRVVGDAESGIGFFSQQENLISSVPASATVNPVPEPSSILLLAGGLTALFAGRRRLFRRAQPS